MMSLLEKNVFSFTWKIENFSMCNHLFEERIQSPIFIVDGTIWTLRVYPRGDVDRNYVSCFLERIKSGDEGEAVTVDFEFIAHSVNPKYNVHRKTQKKIFEFKSNCTLGYPTFCLRRDILNTMNGLLPKDTLTIECLIWKTIDGEQNVPKCSDLVSSDLKLLFSDFTLQKEMFTSAARDELLDFQTQFVSNRYLARTCFQVRQKCIIWPIRRFTSLRPDQRLSIPVLTTSTDTPSFAMTLYLSGESVDDQRVQIEIRIEDCDVDGCFVRCRISAINGSMKARHVAEDEHFFLSTKKDVWKFPAFLQMTSLMEEKYLDATQGTLNLRCEFAFCNGVKLHSEGYESVPLLSQFPKPDKGEFNSVQSMCKQVFEDGKFSDVTLRSGSQAFKAHKDILSARSPVFRAMFRTDMRENETGVVDITDYDPDTVEQLLTFIYTHRVEDMQQEKAKKLFSVADKYGVLSLKWQCSNYLKSILTFSNVCEVLTLADLHQDRDLLDEVQKYIQHNSDIILRSQMWKDLMMSNISLASRVMLDLLTG